MSKLSNTPAFVQIQGHKSLAGRVSTEIFDRVTMIRIDVPETAHTSPFSRLYNPRVIFSITHLSEADLATVAAALAGGHPLAHPSLEDL